MGKSSESTDICLVGGGDFMQAFARQCLEHRIAVRVLLLSDCAEELLVLDRTTFQQDKNLEPLTTVVTGVAEIEETIDQNTILLAFGSRWIFPETVLQKCNNQIYNLNLIPIPNYLGAAHFSWQVLNNDTTGGINVQKITMDVDRGPIYFQHNFQATKAQRPLPLDYFKGYVAEIEQVFTQIVEVLLAGEANQEVYALDPADIRFFPGLRALTNGRINWEWDIDEVDRFIRAFDKPYPGAFALLPDEQQLHLHSPHIVERGDIHPYCAGIVVSKSSDTDLIIAVRGGYLSAQAQFVDFGKQISLKLGTRLA